VTTGPETPAFDIVVLGEILVEVSTAQPFGHDVPAVLGISGDALNVAASAAAAGARVGLISVLTDDDLGAAITDRVCALGISTELLKYRSGQQGVYLVHSDPDGQREFSYARSGSVGSTLSPEDLDETVLASAGAVIASGITCAISSTAKSAVFRAARAARRFVYDPNYRPRLTSGEDAGADLAALAHYAYLVTPSYPGETQALLGVETPSDAAAALLATGTSMVAVTCGADGVHLQDGAYSHWINAVPAPSVIDQTGAGDALIGTMAARLVLGDPADVAARMAAAAASLVVGGRGGTGLVPTLEQTLMHLQAHARNDDPALEEGHSPSNV
jgi:2-dehydro-3-deoxygluconokinase